MPGSPGPASMPHAGTGEGVVNHEQAIAIDTVYLSLRTLVGTNQNGELPQDVYNLYLDLLRRCAWSRASVALGNEHRPGSTDVEAPTEPEPVPGPTDVAPTEPEPVAGPREEVEEVLTTSPSEEIDQQSSPPQVTPKGDGNVVP